MSFARAENKKCMTDMLDTLDESIKSIRLACDSMLQTTENLRLGIMVESQLERTVKDIMDAPEIEGADADGEGGTVVEDHNGYGFTADPETRKHAK